MKKSLLNFIFFVLFTHFSQAQCVPTCSNYAVSNITFTTFPIAGTNAIPNFLPNSDDGCTTPVPIGFNFNFYCTTYSNVLIYSNGLLQFDIGVPSTFPLGFDPAQLIPSVSLPTILNGIVAFKMDDLDPSVGGSVTYTTLGTSPNLRFVLTYSAVPIYGTNLLTSGQIVLYQTSNAIEIYTIDAPLGPNLATQGVENAMGTLATAAPGRNQTFWSSTGSAFRFLPFTPGPPSSVSGPTTICSGAIGNYTTPQQTGVLNYNWVFPSNWTGTSTTSAISGTAGASGNLSVTATYSCGISAPISLSITTIPAPLVSVFSVNPPIVCSGVQFTITPAGGVNYTLNPGALTSNSVFVITATTFTNYFLTGIDANCPATNQATATILVSPSPTTSVNSGSICTGSQFVISPISSAGVDGYNVSGGFLTVQPPTAGVYTYQVVGNNSTSGCNSLPVISSLTVNAFPTLTVTTPKAAICKDESAVFTALGASTYSWSNGLTTSTISVTPPVNTTNFTVTGTSSAGCVKAKTISITVLICTGINDVKAENSGISIYPNPASGILNIRFSNAMLNSTIEIYDVAGKLVMTMNTDSADNLLDLSSQSNGSYVLKVKNDAVTKTFKVIKN